MDFASVGAVAIEPRAQVERQLSHGPLILGVNPEVVPKVSPTVGRSKLDDRLRLAVLEVVEHPAVDLEEETVGPLLHGGPGLQVVRPSDVRHCKPLGDIVPDVGGPIPSRCRWSIASGVVSEVR